MDHYTNDIMLALGGKTPKYSEFREADMYEMPWGGTACFRDMMLWHNCHYVLDWLRPFLNQIAPYGLNQWAVELDSDTAGGGVFTSGEFDHAVFAAATAAAAFIAKHPLGNNLVCGDLLGHQSTERYLGITTQSGGGGE